MRVYKSIYRLDFPLFFSLVDNLGMYAQLLGKETADRPFDARGIDLNLAEHKVSARLLVNNDKALVNLTLKSFDFIVEYSGGVPLGEAFKHPIVALGASIIEALQKAPVQAVERLGIRHWILIERDQFAFGRLRDAIVRQVAPIRRAVSASFQTVDDVAVTLEASAGASARSRTSVGPYREAEQRRYFSINVPVSEALMTDIDIWQEKLEIPKISIASTAKSFERHARSVVDKLVPEMLGILE
jgi:hypothetical protein